MTSGRKLTQEEIDRILELVGIEDCDGEFQLTLSRVANQVGVSRRTVYRVVRRAAASWGHRTKWRSDQNMD